MKLVVEPMELEDIAQVLEVDRESYTLPWPASAYRREVLHNRNAHYLVLRAVSESATASTAQPEDHRPRPPLPFFRWPGRAGERTDAKPGKIVGYAGMWMMVDEAHITTIAIRTEWRGKGLGELLLASLVNAADSAGAVRLTLEVRVSNLVAQRLYEKYGFHTEGVRRRYYSDNNEDAYIMTTENIRAASYEQLFEGLLDQLRSRMRETFGDGVEAPIVMAPTADE